MGWHEIKSNANIKAHDLFNVSLRIWLSEGIGVGWRWTGNETALYVPTSTELKQENNITSLIIHTLLCFHKKGDTRTLTKFMKIPSDSRQPLSVLHQLYCVLLSSSSVTLTCNGFFLFCTYTPMYGGAFWTLTDSYSYYTLWRGYLASHPKGHNQNYRTIHKMQ